MSVLSATAEEYGILIELAEEFGGPVLETGTGNGDGARTLVRHAQPVFTVDLERYGWDLDGAVQLVYDSLELARLWELHLGLAFVDCGWWDHRAEVARALWNKADGIVVHDWGRLHGVSLPAPDRIWDTEYGLALWDRRG